MDIKDLAKEADALFITAAEHRRKIGEFLDKIDNAMLSGQIKIDEHVIEYSIWNNLGIPLHRAKSFFDMLIVYRRMLKTVEEIEHREKRTIHKGMALYNMGIAQANLGNIDAAITNILRAQQEDSRTFGKDKPKPATNLLKDFVGNIVQELQLSYITIMQQNLKKALQDPARIITVLDLGEQLFLSRILKSGSIAFLGDINSRTTLFDALRDLCLLMEVVLRRKSGMTNMLGGLIIHIFGRKSWIANTNFKQILDNGNTTSASTPQDFEHNLNTISTYPYDKDPENNFLMKIFLTCLLVRNFTSHHFDLNITLLTSKNEYDSVFKQVMYGLIYCLDNYV